MSDNSPDDTAELRTPRRWRLSPVWLIPLAAALIGCWLLYDNFASRGPTITLAMDTADGISAGDTKLKVRNVEIGHVTKVALADDYKGAVITVQMKPDTAKLLGDDAKFWVVKPRISPQGVSGLNTLISGAYLQMQPGGKNSDKRRFKVQDSPPSTPSGASGKTVKLVNSGDNTLSTGDPIVYQGQNVGQITGSRFSVAKRQTIYTVFIKQPFSQLITDATQFWLRSGLNLHLGTKGVDLRLGSLQSVLAGGVTFGKPENIDPGKPADNGDHFKLYATHNAAEQDRYNRKIQYVVLLDDSVRGLGAGAPVSYRGLRMGTVEKVPYYPDHFSFSGLSGFKIPVLISIEPQRPSLGWAHWSDEKWKKMNRKFFKHGLRATIKSSNLLTGSMFINLTFDRHAKDYKPRQFSGYPVFPSEPSRFTSIQQQLSDLVNKLNNLDIDPIIDEVKHTATAADDTLEQLRQATHHLNKLLSDSETQDLPAQLNDTLQQLQGVLDNFQPGSPAYQQLDQTLNRLNRVLDNTAPLMRTLRDYPNALIFGHPGGQDPVPKAHP